MNNQPLYIFWSLHQTTTCSVASNMSNELYIFWSLHQTTTWLKSHLDSDGCISFDPYIKPQLFLFWLIQRLSCISFDPYIKPQLPCPWPFGQGVVYLLIPTSNHNSAAAPPTPEQLYIFWSLHQTTTSVMKLLRILRCISFDPYIKPQQSRHHAAKNMVVYLLIPTSNHNWA